MTNNTSSYIDGDGTLVTYEDPYKNLTNEQIQRARELEQSILQKTMGIEISYVKLGRDLSEFNNDECYLACGFPSFKSWADSPELRTLGYRTAHNLIRVHDELVPLLFAHDVEILPSISMMYDLLPMLADGKPEKIIEAVNDIRHLNTRDAKRRIKEIRGLEEVNQLTMFKLHAIISKNTVSVWIYCHASNDHYNCNQHAGNKPIVIKKEHWARFANLFGEENIEYAEKEQ